MRRSNRNVITIKGLYISVQMGVFLLFYNLSSILPHLNFVQLRFKMEHKSVN